LTVAAAGCNGDVLSSELLRGSVGERGMWAHAVVVDAPGIEHGAGLRQRREQRLVEALVPQPADEALGEMRSPDANKRDVGMRHTKSISRDFVHN